MSWRSKQTKRSLKQVKARRLRVEYLEPRQVLSGNVTAVMVGQTLNLTALPTNTPPDFSDNSIQIWQGPTAGQFYVGDGDGATLINGGNLNVPIQFTNVQNISVSLGPGSDTLQFLAQGSATIPGAPGGTRSELSGNLSILNSGGGDGNTVQDVKIDGNLNVARDVTDGSSTLKVVDCIVGGDTTVNYTLNAANGDSNTTIQGSQLRGALSITSGTGNDIVEIDGSTMGSAAGAATNINLGDGGSRVRFVTYSGTPSAVSGQNTTLYGPLNVVSGNGFIGVGLSDSVVFAGTEVKGPVTIGSVSGDSSTIVGVPTSSSLGSDVTVGGPVTVARGAGYDSFDMESSSAPWGLAITNGAAGQTYGSSTKIINSQISTFPPPVATTGLTVIGDDGPDSVVITDSKVGNAVVLLLGNGDNSVAISTDAAPNAQRTTFGSLRIITGSGSDQVTIGKTDVTVSTVIQTGDGQDTINIDYQQTGTVAAPLCACWARSPLMAAIPIRSRAHRPLPKPICWNTLRGSSWGQPISSASTSKLVRVDLAEIGRGAKGRRRHAADRSALSPSIFNRRRFPRRRPRRVSGVGLRQRIGRNRLRARPAASRRLGALREPVNLH